MRLYLKKIVQLSFICSVFSLLLLNFYKREEWSDGINDTPWGVNFVKVESKHRLSFNGQKIHEHVRHSQTGTSLYFHNQTQSYDSIFKSGNKSLIYPSSKDEQDRIVNQMKFIPENVKKFKTNDEVPMKTILLYNGFGGWQVKRGQQTFIEQKCSVNRCILSSDRQKAADADAVIFSHSPSRPRFNRPLSQIWLLYMLESPYHTASLSAFKNVFNWTATYRHDSTIVAPYERFQPFNDSVLTKPQNKNYAAGKTKKVSWFVSNCGARNGRRQYADKLAEYIQVDIYGGCGPLKCPRHQSGKCFEMLNKDYKFYLAFENSNCRDYITEKFFVNGLQHDVIPIVMGGSPDDYRRAAPVHSFIHVDDFNSPKELAEYLHKLDTNDKLYNEYFLWKGTGSFINTYFWCRMCALIHDENRPQSVFEDIDKWWRGPGVCIGQETWRSYYSKNKKTL